jgi:hypothetical protein
MYLLFLYLDYVTFGVPQIANTNFSPSIRWLIMKSTPSVTRNYINSISLAINKFAYEFSKI